MTPGVIVSTFPDSADPFSRRHLGPSESEVGEMLDTVGCASLDELVQQVVPASVLDPRELEIPKALTETEALQALRVRMSQNAVRTSLIGRGYHDTVLPAVIQRCVLENPGWYTAYTPYQAEISQGRLEALLNFQTLICELTAMPVANASLLDEATAAAEAIAMAAGAKPKGKVVFVDEGSFSQTRDVLRTRCEPLDIELVVGNPDSFDFSGRADELIGVVLQCPGENGKVNDFSAVADACHESGGIVIAAVDLLSLVLLRPPGEWGADIVVGSAQRFGVPLGFGGPHAAFLSCSDALKRRLPGRLVGVSRDSDGRPALRLSLQTREQHIRREKATSNICTAQVLLAVIAGFYAVYHGPEGLRRIALRIQSVTNRFAEAAMEAGFSIQNETWFDTLTLVVSESQRDILLKKCREANLWVRDDLEDAIGLSFNEKVVETGEWLNVFEAFGFALPEEIPAVEESAGDFRRDGEILPQPVFHRYRSETEMLRYLSRLESRDIALNRSMIPLGSCTMKLNSAAEMVPLSWGTVSGPHPFAPQEDVKGYDEMISELANWLAEITGFHSVSLQPNAGSQGEYAGLLAIRRFHEENGNANRRVCLIPVSAHGTNPASAVMAGFRVVPVKCDAEGNIEVDDIRAKAKEYAQDLGALMITYPSTHGVFEESVVEICECIHKHGGQVYMDGANLNAQVGLCSPGSIGADVCHLNLHKTFCIPHGGGGPGVGPIGVAEHLTPYLPGHSHLEGNSEYPVSAAPQGSASILTISWMYIAMMGGALRRATEIAILNANYLATRLDPLFPVLYRGANGRVAHECIIDVRICKENAGIDVEDIAKRLIDYGFHAPTMSWPVAGTLMIEPTESESKEELDRFCDAMNRIAEEIELVRSGEWDSLDNPLKNAPHPSGTLLSDQWDRGYSRELAAFPVAWVKDWKYWPPVSRIDNVFGDRNLVCTCEGMEAYEEEAES
jgi:glycine dehydrogenase